MEQTKKTLQKSYCCVIPVYNNINTVEDVVRRARSVIDNVLVIDDGSGDADLTEVLKHLAVEVVRHRENLGKGAALNTALNILDQRNIDYMITLDGDGQHFPEDIPLIIEALEAIEELVLLAGVRDFTSGNIPLASRWGRSLSNYFIRLETGVPVADSQCGFRVYPVRSVSAKKCSSMRYDFESEILLECAWSKIKIVDFPVRIYYPASGERVSHFGRFKDTFRIIKVHLRLLARRFFLK